MAEPGGATTQDGIFYQNTVAARFIADLLDLRDLPPRERVVEIRLEAPADVDDIVVRYADGHRQWIQAKTRVRLSSAPWKKMWTDLASQFSNPDFAGEDRLVLVLGDADEAARSIRELTERASTAPNFSEWFSRLSNHQKSVLEAIKPNLGNVDVLELLRRTSVEISPLDEIERGFNHRRLGTAHAIPKNFLSVLRDIAGGESRRRALLLAAGLRTKLANVFDIKVTEPAEWGLAAYRSTIPNLSRIEIPGTGISGTSEELFVWPRVRDFDRSAPVDFENEDTFLDTSERCTVDFKNFPSSQIDRYIVVAGPGYGKSALLNAIAARLASTPHVPVLIPLGTFAACNVSVLDFLNNTINRELSLRVDWGRLAEQGLIVPLFDGLDEIPTSQRRGVLNRVATFSARHPLVPWLMTVRDPAVISGPADARMVEIMPLESLDIVRFADAMKGRIPDLNSWEFVNRIEAYPDVARLAKIPLFLAMLLAFTNSRVALPSGRADLIECYLKTLFSPHEHKDLQSPSADASGLRLVAEALAFNRLESQEIGATEREVLDAVNRCGVSNGSPDEVLASLLTQGVLRRQNAIRLQFPYPIVQEYLAACFLIREHPQVLHQRTDDAIQRPWAQVVQFALEMHSSPSPLIRQMLMRQDDAFSTGLRLVARCIVNGARVDSALRDQVARQLALVWVESSWFLRERIGRLIVDGFSKPLLPEIRALLSNRRLIANGAGDIVVQARDSALTREVLMEILDAGLERFMNCHSLQPAIDRLGDDALDMYFKKARSDELSDDQLDGLTDLIGSLDPAYITPSFALDFACNTDFSDDMRLQAFCIAGNSLDNRAWPFVERAIRSNDVNWLALKAISRCSDPEVHISRFLRDESLDMMSRESIAGSVTHILQKDSERTSFIREAAKDENFPKNIRYIMLLLSARFGDEQAFLTMVSDLPIVEQRFAEITISLFGHYPNRELGITAAKAIKERVNDSRTAAAFAEHAVFGMTYIYEMDSFGGGALMTAPPHPAADVWADLVEGWMDLNSSTEIEQIVIALAAAKLGSTTAIETLQRLICTLGDPDDAKYDDDDVHGNKIRSAVDELRRRRKLIPIALAERLACCRRPNVPFAGINAIAAHGDHAAINLLVKIYNESPDAMLRSALLQAVEPVAGRLDVVIVKAGRYLQIIS